MPLYEFRCSECRHITEAIKPVNESGLSIPCPKCGKPMSRKFSTYQLQMGKKPERHGAVFY